MKQFRHIFAFEYLSYAKNKAFVATTVILILVMAVVLCFPRFSNGDFLSGLVGGEGRTVAVAGASEAESQEVAAYLQTVLPDDRVVADTADEAALHERVLSEEYDAVIRLISPTQYQYITETAAMTDMTSMTVSEALSARLRSMQLRAYGLSETQVTNALNAAVTAVPVTLGNDQSQTFFYTYILMFLLYMAVMMYGQLVAQSVAVEKSSRAMELLITSAKPTSLMFGKVLGAGAAGFTQLILLLGSAFLLYRINADFWTDNATMASIFDMPLSILLYTILFFVLGFLLYAFLYGALASLASRLEDINTLVMPVTFLMLIAFLVSIFSMLGDVDSVLMRVASFVPFTSPMAMFTRICMGSVAPWEVVLSVALLVGSTIGIGYLAAAIYRVGVLMYGKPPKLMALVRAVQSDRAARRR